MLGRLKPALQSVSHYAIAAFESVIVPLLIKLVYTGVVPDALIRFGIRLLLWGRLLELRTANVEEEMASRMRFIDDLRRRPVAEHTDKANEQHYEVPARYYELCLGPWRKYSSGYWPDGPSMTLQQSEEAALALVVERAELADGMRVLELGCGWGSATLWVASHFPALQLTAVSNSHSQREYIEEQCKARGLDNVRVVTCDINDLELPTAHFDRVYSVEMFEHVKDYETLLRRISAWLTPKGKLFVHIFAHVGAGYHFEDSWMARTFFSGGTMPSDSTLTYFQRDMALQRHWRLSGRHYQLTSEAWLAMMDRNMAAVVPVFEQTYGKGKGVQWFHNWRLFYMACAELFGYNGGNTWIVSHYLFENKGKAT